MTTTTTAAPAVAPRTAPVRGQSFLLLVRTELRKAVDTRSGRVVLAAIVLLSLGAIVFRVVKASNGPVSFQQTFETALAPVLIFLPIVGVLAMTSEWSQRTALTTFTLSPRRVRVLLAKFAAAVVLAVTVVLVVTVASVIGTALAGVVAGTDPTYGNIPRLVAGPMVANALNVVMGAAFGAVLPWTAAALVAFFVMPMVWSGVSAALLKDRADWFDIFAAFTRIAEFRMGEELPKTLTALAIWIVLPLAVGIFVSSRREAK